MLDFLGKNAKKAEKTLKNAGTDLKNSALTEIAKALRENSADIIAENKLDLENGEKAGLSKSLLDRLMLDETRISGIADAVIEVVNLPDPIGEIVEGGLRPNGLEILKVRVPLGVIGIIFEARPNVTADAAALCLKSGNVTILRGGKEAINSNKAIVKAMRAAIEKAGLPADCVQLVEDTSRESATALMRMNDYLDVLIPRGGAGLIRAVVENSTVPVIETGAGNCHAYVDEFANIDMAAEIIYNGKTSRPSVCNALETVLVHEKIAASALPAIKARLDEKRVVIRGCERAQQILAGIETATDEDYFKEYGDYIIAVKVVDSLSEATDHIEKYSTGHSEVIITDNIESAAQFTRAVDSAAVYVNASTRFTDGGVFGMGAEIGISTQKLHARGPMGVPQLTGVKYVIRGNGQVR